MEYLVVSGATPDKLSEVVMEKLADGYLPLGGVTAYNKGLYQALIKEVRTIR